MLPFAREFASMDFEELIVSGKHHVFIANEVACKMRPVATVEPGLPTLLTCDMRSAASYFDVPRDVIAQRLRKSAATSTDAAEKLVLHEEN